MLFFTHPVLTSMNANLPRISVVLMGSPGSEVSCGRRRLLGGEISRAWGVAACGMTGLAKGEVAPSGLHPRRQQRGVEELLHHLVRQHDVVGQISDVDAARRAREALGVTCMPKEACRPLACDVACDLAPRTSCGVGNST